jgi:hypothetical protein
MDGPGSSVPLHHGAIFNWAVSPDNLPKVENAGRLFLVAQVVSADMFPCLNGFGPKHLEKPSLLASLSKGQKRSDCKPIKN